MIEEAVECRKSQLEPGGICRFGHSWETPCLSVRVGGHVGGYISGLPQRAGSNKTVDMQMEMRCLVWLWARLTNRFVHFLRFGLRADGDARLEDLGMGESVCRA